MVGPHVPSERTLPAVASTHNWAWPGTKDSAFLLPRTMEDVMGPRPRASPSETREFGSGVCMPVYDSST